MNHMNKKLLIFLMGIFILSLTSCGQIRDIVSQLKNSNQSNQAADDVVSNEGIQKLINDLRAAGVDVSVDGQIQQPFFPVTGQVIDLDDGSIQVFEFADQSARQRISDTISATGDKIGTFIPSWIDHPNFWADGTLIVLYVGDDEALIELLSEFLGSPITAGEDIGNLPPEAVLKGQRVLAQALNAQIDAIQIIEYEQAEWSDGCLGLGRPDEGCLTVITPGWRVTLEFNGQRYEVRTDKSGEIVRWQQLVESPVMNKAYIYLVALDSSDGEVIGCGDTLIPIEITLKNSAHPIQDTLYQLLILHEQYYGQSGLYNALYQSRLVIDSVVLDSDGTALVNLSGELMLGGTCDVPRVQAQLERTVNQFESVGKVKLFLNGRPLDEILSGAGLSEQSVDYNGISFEFPSTLTGQVTASNVLASATEAGIPFITQLPEHIRFDFTDYVDSKSSIQAQIRVVSVEKLLDIQPSAGNLIALLRTIMAIKPELLITYLDVLPSVNTSNMMFAQVQAVEFQNGKGVRLLSQYSSGKEPINNAQLFYTYQGITNDGKYYVAAILPVSHPDLPDTAEDMTSQELAAMQEDYATYLEDINNVLDNASMDSFTPDLTILDEMIASLQISASE